ncbi:response regulator transcription factor [Oscillochloris sp. ZM17-4]|uniref:response regulator transcription factor n=1 Tax=Oscillochloris sp. ZM17-4 TaxID=2866714 RepID=UPI001C72FBAE|nr:response regulator transcription factor [Oscillochloris sp. ZM17-4]MBX0330568.1 response regulator transcription factor [Oscillochloris sp. ZM17-4]
MTELSTILIVDDQPELLLGLQITLEAAGYNVLTALDGNIALDILHRNTISLILADIAMPELNGYQLFEQIRADPELLRIPFIFLTARAMASDIRYGKTLGVDDYLIKPIKPEDLLAVVEGRLRRARELKAAAPPDLSAAERLPPTPSPAASAPELASDLIEVGGLWVAPSQHRVWLNGDEITFSAREFRVLECLARRAGQVVPPREIVKVSHMIDTDDIDASGLLRPLIRILRRRLGYEIGEMGCIENVRGVGYRLVAPEG